MPPTPPVAETLCPRCGQPNACVPAACGSFEQPCWCSTVRIAAAVLNSLPPEQRGRACLCRTCATASSPPIPIHQEPSA